MTTEKFNNRTWSAKIVKEILGITDEQYQSIHNRMQEELRSRGLSGRKLNTTKVKDDLPPILAKIQIEFSPIFDEAPHPWRERCIFWFAQRNNYNSRRRTGTKRPRVDSEEERELLNVEVTEDSDHEPRPSSAETRTEQVCSVRHTVIYCVGNGTNDTTICMPQHIQKDGASIESPNVNDLDFKRFISLITIESGYDERKDVIVYTLPGLPSIRIKNEREWQTAIEEMVVQGLKRISFVIQERRMVRKRKKPLPNRHTVR